MTSNRLSNWGRIWGVSRGRGGSKLSKSQLEPDTTVDPPIYDPKPISRLDPSLYRNIWSMLYVVDAVHTPKTRSLALATDIASPHERQGVRPSPGQGPRARARDKRRVFWTAASVPHVWLVHDSHPRPSVLTDTRMRTSHSRRTLRLRGTLASICHYVKHTCSSGLGRVGMAWK